MTIEIYIYLILILYNACPRRIHLGSVVQAAEKEVSREVKSDKELQTGFAKKGAFQKIPE